MEEYEFDEREMRKKRLRQASRLKWLRKNPRAMHFFLFRLLANKNLALVNTSIRTKLDMPQLNVHTPDVVMSPQNTVKINNKGEINLQDLDINLQDLDLNFSPPKCEQANGLDFSRITNTDVIPDVMEKIIDTILKMYRSTRLADQTITEVMGTWANVSNQFPRAFSWLDKNNEEQCLWVWEQMRKKYISIDTKPISCEQRYHFIIAIFDNWKGWSDEQLGYLKENKRRKNEKLISHGLGNASILSHKEILLEELGKAWEQKSRRKKIKDTAPPLKLNKTYQKKLSQIAESKSMTLDEALKCIIDNECSRISG
ncbi:hypothetical protein M4D07_15170 [Klebsiella pneumoniae]|jgi:hypothetical protein|uniref:hypothetical protein n=1 Tax=Klebsiella pneumoniae TaxID=573 RepID=UPI000808C3E5|nr:hypothetical protein [Klebsiella pneumoniae]MBH3305643.1 hypothetical protein [Serratia marcescens]HDS4085811.1 hypothetical protein [Klebsiella pneumoniae subsp. pneumoniae]MBA1424679.1 hypothetical protein [Klebsiella pneumoniae]MBZ1973968.1 hypothetical protein [Klebsiella pneumoniae]MCD5779904.1 hypothetical protein [Klebsiella pneumoniae]